MKTLKVFVMALGLFVVDRAGAQVKIGYISVENMISLMPDYARVDTLIQKFQADSLQPRYNYTLSEYMRKDSIVNGKDSVKYPLSVRNKIKEEMQDDAYELQNWQAIAQQAVEAKQQEYLAPIYKKVVDAIKQVAKEKGYTHVLSKEAFLVAPDADDMLLMVAEKLKVKVPPQLQAAGNKPTTNPIKTGN